MSLESLLHEMRKNTAIDIELNDDISRAARISGESRVEIYIIAEKTVDRYIASGHSLQSAISKTKTELRKMISILSRMSNSSLAAPESRSNASLRFSREEIITAARRAATVEGCSGSSEAVASSIIQNGKSVGQGYYEFDGWSSYNQAKQHAHDGTEERTALNGTGSSPSALLAKAVASAKADLQRQRADHFWVQNGMSMDKGHKHFTEKQATISNQDISNLEGAMNIKVTSSSGVPAAYKPYHGNSAEGALSYALSQQGKGNAYHQAILHLESVSNIVVTDKGSGGGVSHSGGSGISAGSSSGGSSFSNVVIY